MTQRPTAVIISIRYPHLSSDGATQLTDESELVLLSVALHYRTSGPHFCHDAARSPQVNRGAVVSLTL